MKTKPVIAVAVLALILSVASVSGQAVIPSTGAPPGGPVFDPRTGLPISQEPDWKDPNWKDPDIVLADVNFEELPISAIVSFIREHFKGEFDIIVPTGITDGGIFNGLPVRATDWNNETILQLHLKNVTASELFNAMNMLFENDKTPLRWELKINGHRQIALLRVLVDPNPNVAPAAVRRIYFVGDLIGDEKNGGMSMEQIIKTITDVWQMADTANGNIQFHKDAQLLVVSGTPSQVDFVNQTLVALRDRQHHAQEAAKSDGSKASPATKK